MMTDAFVDCPKCGRPKSAPPDRCCDQCEEDNTLALVYADAYVRGFDSDIGDLHFHSDGMMLDCPKCGRPKSARPGNHCDQCVEEYLREREADYKAFLERWPYDTGSPPSFGAWLRGEF